MIRFSNAAVAALSFACALSVMACCKKKSEGDEAPAASASASAKTPTTKKSLEEALKDSVPVAAKPTTQLVASHQLKAELCTIKGVSFHHESSMSVLRALAVVGDQMILADDKGTLRGLTIERGGGCTLSLDAAFGQGGTLKLDNEIKTLSHDDSGRVYASNGIFATFGVKGHKLESKWTNKMAYLEMHPSGKWGLGSFANADVIKTSFEGGAVKTEPWVLKNLGRAGQQGPFNNVNSIGFVGDLVLVGGVMSEKVDGWEPRQVVAFDAAGKEKFRFGATGKGGGDDKFGWVHAIKGCKQGICVLDANMRALTLWTKDGKFIGKADLKQLFGVTYPWIPSFEIEKGGVGYFIVGQDRVNAGGKSAGVAEGLIFRVSGL